MIHKFTDQSLKKKLAVGMIVLSARRFLMQVVLTVSNIMLARILAPNIFGAFAIISFLITTFGILVNFGLGPAIVQHKDELNDKELQSIFTLLTFGSLFFVCLVYILSPLITFIYKGQLVKNDIFWLQLYSWTVVLNHLGVISTFLLERNLEYQKKTIGELVTIITTQSTAIYFALNGFGLGSFVLGSIIGQLTSVIIFFILKPWHIGLSMSFIHIRRLLPFGLNYQANTFIGAVNAVVVPVVIGTISGPTAVGYITWAGGIRQSGLAAFDTIEKIIFPGISRAQKNRIFLKSFIEKMIALSSLVSFPLLTILLVLAPYIITNLYTDKWLEGLTTLYLSILHGFLLFLSTLFIDVLLAFGEARRARNISLLWALTQWAITIPLVILWNFNGVIIASMIVSSTFFIPMKFVKNHVDISVWPQVTPYFIYSVIVGIILQLLQLLLPITTLLLLCIHAILGILLYGLLIPFFKKKEVINIATRLKDLFFPLHA